MTVVVETLPLTETITPADQQALAASVTGAHASGTPVYPIGGGTSLDFGLPAVRPGIGIATNALNRVIDYPARDMTITVEAGITLAELATTLVAEQQWLPIDAPQPAAAAPPGRTRPTPRACEAARRGGAAVGPVRAIRTAVFGPAGSCAAAIRPLSPGVAPVAARGQARWARCRRILMSWLWLPKPRPKMLTPPGLPA